MPKNTNLRDALVKAKTAASFNGSPSAAWAPNSVHARAKEQSYTSARAYLKTSIDSIYGFKRGR